MDASCECLPGLPGGDVGEARPLPLQSYGLPSSAALRASSESSSQLPEEGCR